MTWVDRRTGTTLIGGVIAYKEENEIVLRDDWRNEREPKTLRVFENAGWWPRIKQRLKGLQPNSYQVPARPVASHEQVSETGRVKLGPDELTGQTVWVFRDDANRQTSGPLTVALRQIALDMVQHKGRQLHGAVGVSLPTIPGPKADFGGETGSENTLSVRISALTDPKVHCRLLFPWASGDYGLVDWVASRMPDISREEVEEAFREVFGERVLVQPEGWTIRLDKDSFDLDAGAHDRVDITITAENPGKSAFVIEAVVDENDRDSVVSEIIEVTAVEAEAPMLVAAG